MSIITLENLRTAVRSRADMLNSSFVDDSTEVDRWINECAAELHDEVVSRFEDQFTLISDPIVVSSGSTIALSTLPASAPFYKLRGIDVQEGTDWWPLKMFDFTDRGRRAAYGARGNRYRLVGANVMLTPEDDATGTYRLWYIPGYVDLVAGTDTLTYDQNWFEFVIAGAAVKALAKEESDASSQIASKESVRARVRTMASNRDAGGRMRIEDVRRGRRYDSDDD